MYEGLLNSLCDCLDESRKLLIRRITAPDGTLESLLYSLKENIDIIFFLTDFQKKDFVREWCEQHEKETCLNIETFRDLAEELDEFPYDHPTKSTSEKYDDIINNLSKAISILDKMISDMRG
ncbi:MAG: hypothetical protein IIT65_06890 [Lachnospiraceae bacterium]|nr:hypothetical protein [Lachnospiraceae bacterium]